MTRLSIHPDAHVFGPNGQVISPGKTAPDGTLLAIPDQPVTACVASVLGALESGAEFCVHATGTTIATTAGQAGYLQCMSSGSTGTPKRIRRSHDSWTQSFEVNADLFEITSADHYAVLGALSHSLSLYGVCEALALGADLSVLAGLRPDRQAERLGSASVLYATPTQLRLVASQRPQLAQLRLILVGGGALDAATRDDIQRCAPNARIHVFFGASETSFVALSDATTPLGSVGKAYPRVDLVLQNDDGNAVGPDTPGEIWVRSPYLFDGYATGKEAATRVQDGWVSVGEFGTLDAEGHLTILGRGSRMFTVADQNVFPEEIETWLRAQAGVADAVVLPAPDAQRGQVPVAYISGEALEEEVLLRQARKALGPTKAPRGVRLLSDMPRLPSGKPDLQALEKYP